MKHIKIYEDFTNEGSVSWNPGKPKMKRTVYSHEGFFNTGSGRSRNEVNIAGETESGKFISFSGGLWTKDRNSWTPAEGQHSAADKEDIKTVLTAWKGKIDGMIKDQPYMQSRKNALLAALGELNESELNENKKWLVFLPIKKDGNVDIDSDQFGVYTDQEYERYAPFNVYGGPDYTTSLSFPDMKKAQEFADLVKKAKGDVKSSDYAKAAEFERKNKINESELNEGAEPKLEKHNHFIILKGDDVMDNAQTFEKAVEIYNSLKPKSRLIDGREIYQRVWQEK